MEDLLGGLGSREEKVYGTTVGFVFSCLMLILFSDDLC